MNPGALRHRIDIQSVSLAADTIGGSVETWATITGGAVWARVKPLEGRESSQADQTMRLVTHSVTIRYLSTVTTAMRVKFGARIMRIVGIVNQDERNEWSKLMCEEVRLP